MQQEWRYGSVRPKPRLQWEMKGQLHPAATLSLVINSWDRVGPKIGLHTVVAKKAPPHPAAKRTPACSFSIVRSFKGAEVSFVRNISLFLQSECSGYACLLRNYNILVARKKKVFVFSLKLNLEILRNVIPVVYVITQVD